MSIRATCDWGSAGDVCIIAERDKLLGVLTFPKETHIVMSRVQARKLARQLYALADRCEWDEAKLEEVNDE